MTIGTWISVKDKLPPEDIEILSWCKSQEISIAFDDGEEYAAIDTFVKWNDNITPSFCTERFYQSKVTHWMPLPERPTEKQDESLSVQKIIPDPIPPAMEKKYDKAVQCVKNWSGINADLLGPKDEPMNQG